MDNSQARLDELISHLREQGFRLTPQRMAVLQVLVTSKKHLSVDQVYERVRADFPMTSRATVYKTMSLLKELDEVLELEFGEGGNRYDGKRPTPHPHLICVVCDSIVDLDLDDLDGLMQQVSDVSDYELISHRLDFYGICPGCQTTRAARDGAKTLF